MQFGKIKYNYLTSSSIKNVTVVNYYINRTYQSIGCAPDANFWLIVTKKVTIKIN